MPKADPSVCEKDQLASTKARSFDRFYHSSKNTKRPINSRTWRTREDPFASVWEEIRRKLELNPLVTTTKILSDLILKDPEHLKQSHCRTLQGRVKTWHREQHHHEAILRQLLLPDSMQLETLDEKSRSKTELKVER